MIHQYKLNGYNIILDTYSGAVHVTDEVAYDAIAGLDAGKDRETIGRELMETYRDRGLTMEDVADTFSDIDELIQDGKLSPELIIGVPVGFVNVVQSKELIMQTNVPYIVAKGRKGGSNIAACICNALLYMMDNDRG